MSTVDALAPIRMSLADLQQAQADEISTLETIVADLKDLASKKSVDPADVQSLADSIESSVAALRQANTDGQAALAQLPASTPAPAPAPSVVDQITAEHAAQVQQTADVTNQAGQSQPPQSQTP